MRFFFCVDNNFKLWIKYFLVRFNVDKTLKYNIPYPTHVIYHTYNPQMAPLEGSCRNATEGWLISKCYTNRATNDRPYAHVISIHKGAVATRLKGGISKCYTNRATNDHPYTRYLNTQGSCRVALYRYIKRATNDRPYARYLNTQMAPLEGSCRDATEGWLILK